MKKRVADIIFETLVEYGIKDCFLVVGGGAMHLDNALALNNSINKICNHHEQACTMAAEAYARVSGRMAVACVTSGPGATNAITGVMGAWQDSIPMIVISGQVRYNISSMSTTLPLRYRGIQEFDIVTSVKNMTKYAVMLTNPLDVRYEISKAVNIAMDGRRGPVWIDVPLDIQGAIVDTDDLKDDFEFKKQLEHDYTDEINNILDVLNDAKRPCILAGTGIISADVKDQFVSYIEKLDIPVIGGGWCTDLLYTDHPLYFGHSGDVGPRVGNFIIQNADVILVLGNSLSFRQTGYAQDRFAPNAKIIWVDIDKNESLKPGMRYERFINIDLHDFFMIANSTAEKINVDPEWLEYCNKIKKEFSPYESIVNIVMSERVNSYYFWKVFDEFAKEDQIIAMGNSRANAARIQIGVKKKNQRAITNYLCGSMGYDLPAAIGCAVATQKSIICVTGDGSIMMNLQELQTIAHNELPIKIVIFSNDGYEAIRQTCNNFFNGVYIGCTKESGISFPDFNKIANAFGFEYCNCKSNEDVKSSIKKLLESKNNMIMVVDQQINNPVIPKIMSRMNDDGSFETPALQDMYPFIDRKKLDSLMFW